jgi:hypothetical protein
VKERIEKGTVIIPLKDLDRVEEIFKAYWPEEMKMSDRLVTLKDGPLAGAVMPVPNGALGVTVHFDDGSIPVLWKSCRYSFAHETDAQGRETWAQGPRIYEYPFD